MYFLEMSGSQGQVESFWPGFSLKFLKISRLFDPFSTFCS